MLFRLKLRTIVFGDQRSWLQEASGHSQLKFVPLAAKLAQYTKYYWHPHMHNTGMTGQIELASELLRAGLLSFPGHSSLEGLFIAHIGNSRTSLFRPCRVVSASGSPASSSEH